MRREASELRVNAGGDHLQPSGEALGQVEAWDLRQGLTYYSASPLSVIVVPIIVLVFGLDKVNLFCFQAYFSFLDDTEQILAELPWPLSPFPGQRVICMPDMATHTSFLCINERHLEKAGHAWSVHTWSYIKAYTWLWFCG